MKPWVMWVAALTGILISLTLRTLLDRAEPLPAPPQHADVSTSNWDRRIAWTTSLSPHIVVMPAPGELERIAAEKPLLFLENGRGDRAVVGAYQVEGDWLSLSDVRDLEPVQYVQLVAIYSGREERLSPVLVDLRTQR
ncbi:MAG TPA: hypothetical protein VNT75_15005 [Symbiobacteriaceae bacterium]|nr:hypothetical protein [Symbiobacteriaceae bacterium]